MSLLRSSTVSTGRAIAKRARRSRHIVRCFLLMIVATSSILWANAHSLSYQPKTRKSPPGAIEVCRPETTNDSARAHINRDQRLVDPSKYRRPKNRLFQVVACLTDRRCVFERHCQIDRRHTGGRNPDSARLDFSSQMRQHGSEEPVCAGAGGDHRKRCGPAPFVIASWLIYSRLAPRVTMDGGHLAPQ